MATDRKPTLGCPKILVYKSCSMLGNVQKGLSWITSGVIVIFPQIVISLESSLIA